MGITVHTMEYRGGAVASELALREYADSDYPAYKTMYEQAFWEMRSALGLPYECCSDRETLAKKSGEVFILEENGALTGSVAVCGNEIDDLVVDVASRRGGRGEKLLRFAVALLQSRGAERITLHVADWNRGALAMYRKNGFVIVNTETF